MLDKFWESIGSNLADEWQKYVFSPAFFFWAGGFGIYVIGHGWKDTWDWITGLQIVEQAALLIIILMVLILSSLLMKALRFDILRLLEGYWPQPFRSLADWLSDKKDNNRGKKELKWNEFKGREDTLMRREKRNMAKLETRLHYMPSLPENVQPTVLGNILRAGETIPSHKFGLDAIVCWPRLWLLLPENAREELSTTRNAVMEKVELLGWGFLFLIWVIWSPWALLIGVVWMLMASHWVNQAGMAYADLIESTFDLHRWLLYEAAHWELPTDNETENELGSQLNEFFWRGQMKSKVVYKKAEKENS